MHTYKKRPKNTEFIFNDTALSKTVQQILANRGVQSNKELNLSLKNLQPASELKGLKEATELLNKTINDNKNIVIIGDFDADGATSTALMMLALTDMGASNLHYLVPDRFKFGYGLTPEIVELAIELYQPDLIITVDNGISSIEGVEKAKQQSIQVIITDHHLTSKLPPAADAVVNPNQLGCNFSSKALAGVGVAFYVLASLSSLRKAKGLAYSNVAQYLDLVALGTVADVAQLDQNNRILVNAGLQRIHNGVCRQGIQALLDVAGKKRTSLTCQDLGFVLGPRINAAGRMDNMKIGIQCLLANNYTDALVIANQLEKLNQERRSTEAYIKEQALGILADIQRLQEASGLTVQNRRSIILYQPDWHQGVIGIVAGRLKDTYYCPAIVFAPSDESGTSIKGSARSIDNIHIRDAIERIAEQYPHLITHFGGHAMAAGLNLKTENFSEFAQAFDALMHSYNDNVFTQTVLTDGELQPEEIHLSTVYQLASLEPWGTGFPAPIFEGNFKLLRKQLLKDKHLKLTLQHPISNEWLNAIQFNTPNTLDELPDNSELSIVYTLDENHYNGRTSLQLKLLHVQLAN